MATKVVPIVSREEELDASRKELARRNAQLAERELSLASLKAELAAFGGLYLRRVGVLYAELDEWVARLAELRAEQVRSPEKMSEAKEARGQARESYSEAHGDTADVQPFTPSDDLKELYREAAARIHQCASLEKSDRMLRERLLKGLNSAFAASDQEKLSHIIADLVAEANSAQPRRNGAESIHLRAQLNQSQVMFAAIENELASLGASETALLRHDAECAQQEGRDLLSEIAAAIQDQIAAAKKEYDDEFRQVSPAPIPQSSNEPPSDLSKDTEPLCLAKVRLNGKWGYLGTNGRFVVPPVFGSLGEINCGRASFSYSSDDGEGTWGYLNLKGEEVIPAQFGPAVLNPKGLNHWNFVDGLALVPFQGRYGYISKDGTFAIQPAFEDARPFFNGAASVKLNGRFCFIDKSGKHIGQACDYIDRWPAFRSIEAVVPAQSGRKWGFINYRGEFVIEPFYDRVEATECGNIWSAFSEERITLLDSYGNIASRLSRDQYWGDVICYDPAEKLIEIEQCYSTSDESPARLILDENGNHVVCEGDCKKIGVFRDGVCPVFENEDSYFINRWGERITDASLQAAGDFRFGRGVVRRDDLYGYIDNRGNPVTPVQFKFAHGFLDQYAHVLTLDDEWKWINSNGDIVAAPCFEENGKCGLGLQAWPFQRPGQPWSASREFRKGFCRIELDGKYGFVDTRCRIVVEPRFDEVRDFSGGLAAVKDISGKWGYVDSTGVLVVEPQFDEVRDFTNELAAVKDNRGKWGYVNKVGEIIVRPIFDATGYPSNGLAAVKVVGGKWGYMNMVGEIVITPQYDYAGYFRPMKK